MKSNPKAMDLKAQPNSRVPNPFGFTLAIGSEAVVDPGNAYFNAMATESFLIMQDDLELAEENQLDTNVSVDRFTFQ
jgi:hypothetical protein